MPTTLLTGRSVTLELGGDDYEIQAKSVTLQVTNDITTVNTLSGNKSIVTNTTGTLVIDGFQDYNSGHTGLADSLYADALAGTSIAFTMDVGDATFTGNVIPNFPTAGGDAVSVLEYSVTCVVDGEVTKA